MKHLLFCINTCRYWPMVMLLCGMWLTIAFPHLLHIALRVIYYVLALFTLMNIRYLMRKRRFSEMLFQIILAVWAFVLDSFFMQLNNIL